MTCDSNNMFVFPAVGLGVLTSSAAHVNERMFYKAAQALSGYVSDEHLAQGQVAPRCVRPHHISTGVPVHPRHPQGVGDGGGGSGQGGRRGRAQQAPPQGLVRRVVLLMALMRAGRAPSTSTSGHQTTRRWPGP